MLGAILGRARAGEQTLLRRLVRRRPDLFAGRVICFDRNFPGHELITAILDAGGHVIARVKEGISLPFDDGPGRGWLPDGSRLTWLNAPSGKEDDRLPVRAAEHNAILPRGDGTSQEVSETCTVITTLLGYRAAPADKVREAYLTRWSASETTFGEDKATITGAGNRTSGPVLRSGSPRLVIQEAWAWLTAAQLTRASAAAALRGGRRRRPRPAPERRRPGDGRRGILHRRPPSRDPVHDNFPGHGRIIAGRARRRGGRRRPRRPAHPERPRTAKALRTRPRKHAPKFPHATATKTTVTGKPQVTVFAPRILLAPAAGTPPSGRRNHRGPWNRTPAPPRHAGQNHYHTPNGNRLQGTHRTPRP